MASENDPAAPEASEPPTLPVDATPAAGDDTPPPAKKRAPRKRATKKAAAPEAAPADTGAAAAADEPVPDTAGDTAADVEAVPAKAAKKATKTARKASTRSRKKAAEPAESAAPTSEVAPEEAASEGATPPDEAPQEAVPAKRARRRATRTAAEAAPVEPPAADPFAPPVAAPAPVAAPEVEDENEDETDAPAAEAPTGAPGLGLLFQAPEPARATRRRASSAAGAPAEVRPEPVETERPAVDDEPAAATPDDDDTDTRGDREAGDGSGDDEAGGSRRRRRGGRGRRGRGKGDTGSDGEESGEGSDDAQGGGRSGGRQGRQAKGGEDRQGGEAEGRGETRDDDEGESGSSSRRRRRRRRGSSGADGDDPPGTVTKVREPRSDRDEPTAVKGSTRLEAKKQRRREGREAGRRRTVITEAEFLARRESVERTMVVRGRDGRTQIGVLEDGVLVEHYVSRETTASMAGNVYLGRVQNVLPSMEAAFVDIGKGRNAVLYAGEVNWDAAGLEGGQAKRIENALSSGDTVLVQVTKDPIGHKGARLTSQISLPGRYVVYVPEGSMTGISRKLPDTERARLKAILKEVVPDGAGVIVRTAAEGASEAELTADVERLTKQWERIQKKADSARAKKSGGGGAPQLLHGEPDLTIRVIRDVFTEDFASLVVSGEKAWSEVSEYVEDVAPDLAQRLTRWTEEGDVFAAHRIDEQIAKAMDRKVWLPSGGSLVIDRTEAMTVVDVNTGKFVGSGGNLEETVTKNNLEAAEEIVRQLRLRDIGGIIVVDFIDMVLESNRDLVVRRLLECLGRDRTKHQVAEVTSLGLVQMTRKRVGSGLIEVFSEQCDHCAGRGIVVHTEPVERGNGGDSGGSGRSGRSRSRGGQQHGGNGHSSGSGSSNGNGHDEEHRPSGPTAAQIAAAAHAAALKHTDQTEVADQVAAEVAAEVGPAVAGASEETTGGTVPPAEDAASTGSTATSEPPAPQAGSSDAAPVAESSDLAGPSAPSAPPSVEPEPAPVPEPVAAPEPPAARPRRRRGRVVAPAGPPPGSEPAVVPDGAGSDEG